MSFVLNLTKSIKISNFYELDDAFEAGFIAAPPELICEGESELPCYTTLIERTERLDSRHPVSPENFLSLLDKTLVVFSVTSKEDGHERWLEAAKKYPGTQIQEVVRTETVSSGRNRPSKQTKYTCYFVTINMYNQTKEAK